MSDQDISQSSSISIKTTKHKPNKEYIKLKREIYHVIQKVDRLYPQMCADVCARHTANILQKGNGHKVMAMYHLAFII